jgi:hypothetical protein
MAAITWVAAAGVTITAGAVAVDIIRVGAIVATRVPFRSDSIGTELEIILADFFDATTTPGQARGLLRRISLGVHSSIHCPDESKHWRCGRSRRQARPVRFFLAVRCRSAQAHFDGDPY